MSMMNTQINLQRSNSVKYQSISNEFSSLPLTFISSLRQLFSILDKNNSGSIPFVVFKQYFHISSSTIDFLNDLEIESKSNDNLITFPLLIHVIQRAISTRKSSEIFIPKSRRLINRSKSNLTISRKLPDISKSQDEINFSMIRALKRFEIERDLLIQTSETIEHVKLFLNERLIEMKTKQKSYCQSLSIADTKGIEITSMFNRDLIADLLKLANTVLQDGNCDINKLISNSSLNNQLKLKDNYIKRLEIEKHLLLKQLIELRHDKEIIISMRNS